MIIPANNPKLRSWVTYNEDSNFPIQNLPLGLASRKGGYRFAAVAIGDQVLDLSVLAEAGLLGKGVLAKHADGELPASLWKAENLNALLAKGKPFLQAMRQEISLLLQEDEAALRDNQEVRASALVPLQAVDMHLPVAVGDYTDFYSSEQHAYNVGCMFRDPKNALMPNWKHIPVGYHGRSSSIVVSGTPIIRPMGQMKAPDAALPHYGASKRLDFELEMAFVTCGATNLGDRITVDQANDYIYGFMLFNDWSARDIQAWEYVPLGPFLGKSFGSTLSPWIVPMDALLPFRTQGPTQEPAVLPYLEMDNPRGFDIALEVGITPEGGEETVVCHSNYKYMYWAVEQQLAHQSLNGCNINVGDIYASGTISGPGANMYGSMLELAWKGTKPVELKGGQTRSFIADGDRVTLRGYAQGNGYRIGFGEADGLVLPAK